MIKCYIEPSSLETLSCLQLDITHRLCGNDLLGRFYISPVKWRQRPDMTIAVALEIKPEL